MENGVDFYDQYYFFHLMNRLSFFLMIWNDGSYKSDIEKKLVISKEESLVDYSNTQLESKFISIENRLNPDTNEKEQFYFITTENFSAILDHITRSTLHTFHENTIKFLLEDRIHINLGLIQGIDTVAKINHVPTEKQLFYYLETSIAFFFVFIMQLSPKAQNTEFIQSHLFLLGHSLRIGMEESYEADLENEEISADIIAENDAKLEYLKALRERYYVWRNWRNPSIEFNQIL